MKSSIDIVGYHKNKFIGLTDDQKDINLLPEMVVKIIKNGQMGLNSYEKILGML
jgi:hypothetical protein